MGPEGPVAGGCGWAGRAGIWEPVQAAGRGQQCTTARDAAAGTVRGLACVWDPVVQWAWGGAVQGPVSPSVGYVYGGCGPTVSALDVMVTL